ncbi:MAG: DNA/RNA nuclease SfsA [Clostridia bacterium]|nr:DNA/RNA nuclease SfsA [Clostridia bacterium]MBQ8915157.1 DNA/RNA nuclease SfsA [Clostridia bacterium]
MIYEKIIKATFLSRPNRFIARCVVDGEEVVCHVKNTGRCRELLVPGVTVLLSDERDNDKRKTPFDLVSVYKGERLINMDSQAPNKVAEELMKRLYPTARIQREVKYGESRIDLLVENEGVRTLVEVKGVTLEEDGVVRFPDAPTERGIKHLRELESAVSDGYEAVALFVVQMKDVKHFEPNEKMHPEFAAALRSAKENGVTLLAYDCIVTEDSIAANIPVKIIC